MGLDITKVSQSGNRIGEETGMGSYSTLHILRKWIICTLEKMPEGEHGVGDWFYTPENMKKTQYPTIVNHSDADGGYINFETLGISGSELDPSQWWDTNALQQEMDSLKKDHYEEMPSEVKEVFDRFYELACATEDDRDEWGDNPIFLVSFN